jgi:hypothetical protein
MEERKFGEVANLEKQHLKLKRIMKLSKITIQDTTHKQKEYA